jgi:acetate kinase
MKIMVINSGSSSVKFKLFELEGDSDKHTLLSDGLVEEIGKENAKLNYWTHKMKKDEKYKKEQPILDHDAAINLVMKTLVDPKIGLFKDNIEVDAIGHRVLHGAEKFSQPVIVSKGVKEAIRDCIELGPLHNPANLTGIEVCEKLLPGIPQVAIFDTAFHQTMTKKAYIYGLPYELYERYHIRKYGFHGTSHEYVSDKAAKLLKKELRSLKMVTCHLGNGSSICAIDNGKSFDTSMGLTPLEGLVMGTRCGDMDPAVVTYLMKKEHLTADEMDSLMNKKSGLKGISGVSSDLREVIKSAEEGNARSRFAIDIFCYRITKYIGSYAAAMGGLDTIVFTGGIGENAHYIRQQVLAPLGFFGVKVDDKKNKSKEKEKVISPITSRVKVMVVPTNEELMIAMKTRHVVNELGNS